MDFAVTQAKSDCFCTTASFNVIASGPIPAHTLTYAGGCLWSGYTTICGYTYLVQLSVCSGCLGSAGLDWVLGYINLTYSSVKAWNASYYKIGSDCNPSPLGVFSPQGSDYAAGLPCTPTAYWPTSMSLS